jgi:UDP-N-acetylmuramate--alanine ligase
MVGLHNVQNSLAAIAVLDEIGINADDLVRPLARFNGVKRRFTRVSNSDDFLVIDDYAHHPTEIKAVLKAARASFPHKKLRILFQPHRFSRTRDLLEDFAQSFRDGDSLVLTEIYPALEEPIAGVTTQALVDAIRAKTAQDVMIAGDIKEGALFISDITERNDVVLVLGAGSVTHAAPLIADLLSSKFGVRSS